MREVEDLSELEERIVTLDPQLARYCTVVFRGTPGSPDDAAGEIRAHVFEKSNKFEDQGPGSFGRWYWTVVSHKARDLLRRAAAWDRRRVGLDDAAEPRDPGPSPEEVAEDRDRRRHIRACLERALEQMAPGERQAFAAIFADPDRPLAELAAELGITHEAMRTRVSRAYRVAREVLLERELAPGGPA